MGKSTHSLYRRKPANTSRSRQLRLLRESGHLDVDSSVARGPAVKGKPSLRSRAALSWAFNPLASPRSLPRALTLPPCSPPANSCFLS